MNVNIASCLLICTTLKGASFDKLNGGLNQIEELLKGIEGGEPGEPEHLVEERKNFERHMYWEKLNAERAALVPKFSVIGYYKRSMPTASVVGNATFVAKNLSRGEAVGIMASAVESGEWSDLDIVSIREVPNA